MQPEYNPRKPCCNPMHARYAWDDAQRSGWFVGRVLRRGVPAKDITKTLTLTNPNPNLNPNPNPNL